MPGFTDDVDLVGMWWRGITLSVAAIFMGAGLGVPGWIAFFGPAAAWVLLTGFNVRLNGTLPIVVMFALGLVEIGLHGFPWSLVIGCGVMIYLFYRWTGMLTINDPFGY